jgi:DNA-binding MarR family transcriptional regulator
MPSAPRSRDEFDGDAADLARPPFSPTIALVTLARSVEIELAALLEAHGLSLRGYGILGYVAATPGVSLDDLARRSRLGADSVSVALRGLTEKGLVRTAAGRGGGPTVTRTGSEVLSRAREDVAGFDAATLASPAWQELRDALSGSG